MEVFPLAVFNSAISILHNSRFDGNAASVAGDWKGGEMPPLGGANITWPFYSLRIND